MNAKSSLVQLLNSYVLDPVSSETLTFLTLAGAVDVGSAAGTIVYGKLAKAPILNKIGDSIGEFNPASSLSSSIVFTTDVLDSTLQIGFEYRGNLDERLSNMAAKMELASVANGTWCVDYQTGLIIVKKKTTGVSQSITSYIACQESASNSDNGEVVTAEGDAVSNTKNSQRVSARMQGFNGTTWDRIKAGITTVTATLTGFLNTLPWGIYNATPTTRIEGQGGPFQTDDKGRLIVTLGTELAGENLTNDRIEVAMAATSARITTATTTTARSGAGLIQNILIEVALTGTVTIYDNTAASGTIIAILPIGFLAGMYTLNYIFATGCTLVTSAADRVVVSTLAR